MSLPTSPNMADFSHEPPAYSPSDHHKVQRAIQDTLNDLRELAPALSKAQRITIQQMIGAAVDKTLLLDIDEVTAQYALVLRIRDKVLDDEGGFTDRTDAKGLSALVNSINNLINLFLRHQAKFDHMKEISNMRDAVAFAISELEPEAQQRFFSRLEDLNREYV